MFQAQTLVHLLRIDRSYCWEVNYGLSGYNIAKSENVRNNVHFLLVTVNRGSIYKYKNNCLKLKNEVGMEVLKSKQTRVVEIISTYV